VRPRAFARVASRHRVGVGVVETRRAARVAEVASSRCRVVAIEWLCVAVRIETPACAGGEAREPYLPYFR
jgi:hypothetical protein